MASGDWIVKFYSSNCGHCKRLQPSWEALGRHNAEERGYSLGSIDCKASDQHLDACAKLRPGWQGHGWPAIVVLHNGKVLGGMKRFSRIRDVEPANGAKLLDAFTQRALGKPVKLEGVLRCCCYQAHEPASSDWDGVKIASLGLATILHIGIHWLTKCYCRQLHYRAQIVAEAFF